MRHEVNGQDEIHEVAAHQTWHKRGVTEGSTLSNPLETQELWSEECATELNESEIKPQYL